MWGDLAQVMAQGLRGKRLGEERQYGRDQDLLATVDAQNQRAEERKRYQAQQERLNDRDKREASHAALMNPLDLEMARARLANEKAPRPTPSVSWQTREDANGRLIQVNPQTGEIRPLTHDGRPVQGSVPASRGGAAAPKPRTLNAVQDAAGDYVARFATVPDATDRAKQAYQAFLMSGGRPQEGENPDQIWTAFLAASRRMAGETRPPSAAGGPGSIRDMLAQRMAGGGVTPDASGTRTPGPTPDEAAGRVDPQIAIRRADRYEELRDGGMDPAEAQEQVMREFPDA